MNSEMPISSTTAPTATANAVPLLRPLSPEEVLDVVMTVGVVGVVDCSCGSPGANGLPGCASAAGAPAHATAARHSSSLRTLIVRCPRLRERLLHRRGLGCVHVGMLFGD